MPDALALPIAAGTPRRARFRAFAYGVVFAVWWRPGLAHARDVGGLMLLSGRVSLFFAALLYGALTWYVLRNERHRWGLVSAHVPVLLAPFLLAKWSWASSEVELGWVLLANVAACLPLVVALALTKRWSLAALLLFFGSWAAPPLIALVAALVLGVLGLALKPFGLVD